jgi:phosphoserine phosphatase
MRRWADKVQVSLTDSYSYSDHFSDRPLLELVASATVVNPDRQLTELAIEKGWLVLHWKTDST